MFNKILSFIKRPFVGDQTTARLSYQQSLGHTYASVMVTGDDNRVRRSLNAINPAGITPGPTWKPLDASVTGNPASSPVLESLTDYPSDGRSI